jgi:hypothetical protein
MGRRRKRDLQPRKRRKTGGRTPKWLVTATDLDLIAQRRCLMILSVLSGEKSVEDASREGEIVPAQYYIYEKKALAGMLSALVPGASEKGGTMPALRQMEERVASLEASKRRLERLLALTKMALKPGPLTHGKRGRPKMDLSSKHDGPTHSPSLPRRKRTRTKSSSSKSMASSTTEATASSTPSGADAP